MFGRRNVVHARLLVLALVCVMPGLLVPLVFGDEPDAPVIAATESSPFDPDASVGVGPLSDEGGATGIDGVTGTNGTVATPTGSAVSGVDPRTGQPTADSASGSGRPDPAGGAAPGPGAVAAGPPIRVGVGILDTGGLQTIGFSIGPSTESQRMTWQAFVDDLNERGGINGRPVEPMYRNYDILSHDSMRAACLYWTEDAKVFAVLDAYSLYGPAVLCITAEHGTPLISRAGLGFPTEYYQRAAGKLVTLAQAGDRMMRDLAVELHRHPTFEGDQIGILEGGSVYAPKTIDVLQQSLEAAGHTIVQRVALSDDRSAAASQVPVAVQQMRSAGATEIINLVDLLAATQFVESASKQNYNPRYFASDWSGAAGDYSTLTMPAAYEGSVSFTSTTNGTWRDDWPESPTETRCREIYEQRTGNTTERTASYDDNNGFIAAVAPCSPLEVFEAAAKAAGPTLSHETLTAAVQGLGPFGVALTGGGSFGPGKTDHPDLIRTQLWAAECNCWRVAGAFHAAGR